MRACGEAQPDATRRLSARIDLFISAESSNTRPEWRGAKAVEMQTGRAIPRPLQADGWTLSFAPPLSMRHDALSYGRVAGDDKRDQDSASVVRSQHEAAFVSAPLRNAGYLSVRDLLGRTTSPLYETIGPQNYRDPNVTHQQPDTVIDRYRAGHD